MNCYAGSLVTYWLDPKIKLASGNLIIMSIDVCKKLIENREYTESIKIIDDVDIGYTMNKLNIPLKSIPRCDIYPSEPSIRKKPLSLANSLIKNVDTININNYFQYRIKHFDPLKRSKEKIVVEKLLKKIYNI